MRTSGPWKVESRSDTGGGYSIVATEVHYCRAGIAHYASEADANLIAAAPDLLDAATELWAAFSDTDNPELKRIATAARAAIAKALGEP